MDKLPTLHLHVKSCYFEQIKRGEKTEEYRLHNAYWTNQLHVKKPNSDGYCHYEKRRFSSVIIHDAYKPASSKTAIKFPWQGWVLTTITHPHFGNKPTAVFAIQLSRGGAETRGGK